VDCKEAENCLWSGEERSDVADPPMHINGSEIRTP
jgi:hypothetical protein